MTNVANVTQDGAGRQFVRNLRRESKLRRTQHHPTKRAYLRVNGWDRRQSQHRDFRLARLLTVASHIRAKTNAHNSVLK